MKLKQEKSRGRVDVIVADGETTETDLDSTDILGDQPETPENTIKAHPVVEMSGAEAESVLRPVSGQTQRVLDELQTETLDYETEKLLIFSK